MEHQGLEADFTMTNKHNHSELRVSPTHEWPGARLLKNLSIGAKLTLGFGILVMLIFLSAGISYRGSDQATAQIDRTNEMRVPLALAATRAQAHLLRMQANVRGYLALGETQYREDYLSSKQAFETSLEELQGLLNRYPEAAAGMGATQQSQARLDEVKTAYQEWSQLPEQLFELRDDQLDREPAYSLLATDGVRTAGEVLIAVNSLIEIQGQREPTAENLARLEDMAKFQGNFAAMLSALRGYVTTRNRIYRGEYEVNLTDNQNAWERITNKRSTLNSTQQALLDQISQNREAFLALPEQMFAMLESDQWRKDLYLFRTEAVPLSERMRNALGEMVTEQQDSLENELNTGVQYLNTTTQLILSGGIIALILGVVMAYLARATIAAPVRRLTAVAERIRTGDLDAQAQVESGDEIGILAATFNNMTAQLRQTLNQVRKEKRRADDLLEVVIPIGVELASERDFNQLLETMLLEAKAFCHADAGTLYLLRAEDEAAGAPGRLEFVIVRNDTKGIAMGGTAEQAVTFAPLPLVSEDATEVPSSQIPHREMMQAGGHTHIATQVALSGKPINIAAHNRPSDIIPDYRVNSLLTLPLKNREDEVLGVLQLLNAHDPETDNIIAFDPNLQQLMESFSSLAVAALEAYIREQSLKQEIRQLRIEIDEAKRQKQVSEIVETDFFQDLRQKARALRKRGRRSSERRARDQDAGTLETSEEDASEGDAA
jgi:CHASE3 domain sensor protein